MRLKDADELVTILDEELQKDSSLSKVLLVGFAKQILNDAPTIDAVEVVRCKECIHYGQICDRDSYFDGCGIFEAEMNPDGFCSKGKSKVHSIVDGNVI